MNYFEAIWNELNGKFDWSDTDSQSDAITLYDDGQVVLFNEQEAGCIVIGTSYTVFLSSMKVFNELLKRSK